MVDREWDWNGARWWKFDFHSHTPASNDYGRGPNQAELQQLTPREWLLNYMRAGIDCVAVTDHNSGGWIDCLKNAFLELEAEGSADFRPITIFPGVEISVNGGIHLLAIFSPSKTTSDIDSLLGAVEYRDTKGASDGVTNKVFSEVCRIIGDHDGIAIPAHVNQDSGLFHEVSGQSGQTLKQTLNCKSICGIEVVDPTIEKPGLYSENGLQWTEVLGSDAHHPSGRLGQQYPGSHFTWVKMDHPTIWGLRLALLDGNLSIRRSDEYTAAPDRESETPEQCEDELRKIGTPVEELNGHHGDNWIESISVDKAVHMGQADHQDPRAEESGKIGLPSEDLNGQQGANLVESITIDDAYYMGRGEPLTFSLNPWMNTIIGGRGTGKSSLIEFLRSAMRRFDELPKIMRGDFKKYRRISEDRDDDGLLTDETRITVIFRKQNTRFRINWAPEESELSTEERQPPIEEQQPDGTWVPAEGEITQRFPIRIYSQKQIYRLAKEPAALMQIIDQAPGVDRRSWEDEWTPEEKRFLSLRAQKRELQDGLSEVSRIKGELDDVIRKMEVLEDAGHADVLKKYQAGRKQIRKLDEWEASWKDSGEAIRKVAAEVVPGPLEEAVAPWDAEVNEDEKALSQESENVRDELSDIADELERLAIRADDAVASWEDSREASAWHKRVRESKRKYDELQEKLAELNDDDAAKSTTYGELVKKRQKLEKRLESFEEKRKGVRRITKDANEHLTKLRDLRRVLTEKRTAFLARVLDGNQFVQIAVEPYGAGEEVEAELRELLGLDSQFERDIGEVGGEEGSLLGDLDLSGNPEEVENSVLELKERLRQIRDSDPDEVDVRDKRFAKHLKSLKPEVFDRIDAWWPEDRLGVQYSTSSSGTDFSPIEGGSPGQQTAALLAFLLSYGDEPLVLDQPEDDLDNRLIYNLIVRQLWEVKKRRQVIIVTHNPNIVVNGDAELVVALAVNNGRTELECDGGLQQENVRETICRIMEGGPQAFEQRYRRIALGGRAPTQRRTHQRQSRNSRRRSPRRQVDVDG